MSGWTLDRQQKLGEAVRKKMLSDRIGPKAAAQKAGVTVAAMLRAAAGYCNATAAMRICPALGISLDEVLKEES